MTCHKFVCYNLYCFDLYFSLIFLPQIKNSIISKDKKIFFDKNSYFSLTKTLFSDTYASNSDGA